VEVFQGPSHSVSYSPPLCAYDNYDELLDAQLQQEQEAPEFEDREEEYNEAFNGGAGDNIANNEMEGQFAINQVNANAANNAQVAAMEQQAGLMVVAADNPHTHSRVFVQEGMWCTMVESRHPSLTDALWDAGYQMGLRGLFRVPWHNIWGILAQVGMGQHGLGYSVIQMVVLYHNDGHGPLG